MKTTKLCWKIIARNVILVAISVWIFVLCCIKFSEYLNDQKVNEVIKLIKKHCSHTTNEGVAAVLEKLKDKKQKIMNNTSDCVVIKVIQAVGNDLQFDLKIQDLQNQNIKMLKTKKTQNVTFFHTRDYDAIRNKELLLSDDVIKILHESKVLLDEYFDTIIVLRLDDGMRKVIQKKEAFDQFLKMLMNPKYTLMQDNKIILENVDWSKADVVKVSILEDIKTGNLSRTDFFEIARMENLLGYFFELYPTEYKGKLYQTTLNLPEEFNENMLLSFLKSPQLANEFFANLKPISEEKVLQIIRSGIIQNPKLREIFLRHVPEMTLEIFLMGQVNLREITDFTII